MSHEEIGKTYRQLVAVEEHLRMLEEEGKGLIDDLKCLARCFDPEEENVEVDEVSKEEVSIWNAGGHFTIKRPFRAEKVAIEIYELKQERKELEEALKKLTV